MNNTIGIVGLGLIGGSIAKAYKQAGWTVLGYDIDSTILEYANIAGITDGILDSESIKNCDLIHIAVNPNSAIEFMEKNASEISNKTLMIDDCGTKRKVCEAGFSLAKKYGYIYAGGHPMAGTHLSGFKNSKQNMFTGASMIVVPPTFDDIELMEQIKKLLEPMGLKQVVFTTAEEHDRMIAYTSQLAHVVSNAYIKSPSAQLHKGYSAGSFKDLTRVAWLNENMWTELFMENRDNLLGELNILKSNLEQYIDAIQAEDTQRLCSLLHDGRIAKEQSDK